MESDFVYSLARGAVGTLLFERWNLENNSHMSICQGWFEILPQDIAIYWVPEKPLCFLVVFTSAKKKKFQSHMCSTQQENSLHCARVETFFQIPLSFLPHLALPYQEC